MTTCPDCGLPSAVYLGGSPDDLLYSCVFCDAEFSVHSTEHTDE